MRKKLRFFKKLGPGLITGASDDDPSGILTYLQGGAMLGFGSLWTALFTFPMMVAIQETCGRIGLATNKGIIEIIKKKYPKIVLWTIVSISTIVIVINVGADLLAIGTSVGGMAPIPIYLIIPVTAVVVLFCTIYFPYREFAGILKWLTLSLLFYVLAVLYIKINWVEALTRTLIPQSFFNVNSILIIGAIFGTTVSPYLFFWQTNEEIEEKLDYERRNSVSDAKATVREIGDMKRDIFIGMFYSNVVAWFIMAGAASMARSSGLSSIANFQEASMVLRPLLGDSAYFAFVLGIVGSGLLAIPVLAGNIGYMFAEVFDWEKGINKKFKEAFGFYGAIMSATVGGLAIDMAGLDPVNLLVYTALFYTLITPPIVYIILRIANDKEIMGAKWVNSTSSNVWGVITLVASAILVVAYFASIIYK